LHKNTIIPTKYESYQLKKVRKQDKKAIKVLS